MINLIIRKTILVSLLSNQWFHLDIYDNYSEIYSIDKVLPTTMYSIGICSNLYEIIAMIECIWVGFFFQSGQRFDTNSANEGSTNKLETNGFASTQQQVNAQQAYTNNPGQLNLMTKISSSVSSSY